MLLCSALIILSLYNIPAAREAVPLSLNEFDFIYGMVNSSNDILTIHNGIAIYPGKEYANFKIDMDILDNEGSCYGIFGFTDISSIDIKTFVNNLRTQSSLEAYEYIRFCLVFYDKQSLKGKEYFFNGYSYKAIWMDRHQEADVFNESGDVARTCCIGRSSSFAEPGFIKNSLNKITLIFNNGQLEEIVNDQSGGSAGAFPKIKLKIGFMAFGDQPTVFKNIRITGLSKTETSADTTIKQ